MSEISCQICQAKFSSLSAFHRHLGKEHTVTPKDYYPLFFERRDKFDGELIEFKDVKTYFSTDFNSKYNFFKWISPGGKEVQDYSLEILKRRCLEKRVDFIPSQVELKSLFAPSLNDLINIFGGVDFLKAKLDMENLRIKLSPKMPELKPGNMEIYIDTREQTPLSLPSSKVKKLIVGDYCPSKDFFSNVFVERKSMHDLAGTLTKGIERFEKEIVRAKEIGAYLVVVTESSFTDAFEYSPKNSFSQKIGGPYLFNKIRRFMTEYDNIQFVFCRNRFAAAKLVENVFRMGEAAKKVDLEFLKDRGEI